MILLEKYRERICTCCKENFPATLDFFHKQKNGLFGLRPTCIICTNNLRKIYISENKDKISKTNKIWYDNNKEKRNEQIKKYRINNPDKVKKWQEKNTPILIKKRKERRKNDSLFKFKHSVSNLIRSSFKRKNSKKEGRTVEILGCTLEEFKIYIESKFESWMNWDNYGVYKPNGEKTWNFDHIIPLDTAKSFEDVILLNHHTNLRPLCSYENLIKLNKII